MTAKLQQHNFTKLHQSITEQHQNFIIGHINESCLRLAVFTGDFPWHSHPDSDEMFIVLEGELIIELEHQEALILKPNDFVTIPAGVIHRTRSKVRTVNLCFEHTEANTVYVSEGSGA
ncbi:cupin domain-containing protein [Paenibacillus sp. KS-LC4]|uniref:cupin domain-containing protein n=1 Tax=Paenibacillus sp. KS-LC4 TaxID=2979727 RepID=UPI0030D28528